MCGDEVNHSILHRRGAGLTLCAGTCITWRGWVWRSHLLLRDDLTTKVDALVADIHTSRPRDEAMDLLLILAAKRAPIPSPSPAGEALLLQSLGDTLKLPCDTVQQLVGEALLFQALANTLNLLRDTIQQLGPGVRRSVRRRSCGPW